MQIISVFPEFTEGLLGIAEADRLQILYWMHRLDEDDRRILQCHPRADTSRPLRGVFALRSPMRPNPIGSTVVDLQKVRDGSLVVTGLDAEDGSPVIDIKISS
ncbi:MAG: tRNA (N6-threonylcarbamoyladenosine(37)-N6)-methyltransferase TrmO [Planctomycetota bacterium]